MADVPTDILLFIIELVCKEDASTLKTLSLTSVIFRDLCQQRLFKSVRLRNSILVKYSPTIPPLFLSKFHDVVTNSPRIASYIRELKIGQYSMPASGGLRHYRAGVPMLWMIDHSTMISQIFDALELSPIRTFAFTSRRRIGWNELDKHFRVSLSRILRNPSFETISIDGLTIPGHFFADFTSLREVTLLRLDLLPGTMDLPPSTRTHLISHLTFSLNLQYDLDGAELPKIKCLGPIIGLDLSSIEVLDVELNFGLVPELSRHLLHLRNLRYLKLSTHPYGENPFDPNPPQILDLSGLPQLRELVLCNLHFGAHSASFRWLADAFNTLKTPQVQQLERVVLLLLTKSDALEHFKNFEVMVPFGQYLSSLHQKAGKLRSIQVHMKVAWGDDDTMPQIRKAIISGIRWDGCERVLDVIVESDMTWFYRNR